MHRTALEGLVTRGAQYDAMEAHLYMASTAMRSHRSRLKTLPANGLTDVPDESEAVDSAVGIDGHGVDEGDEGQTVTCTWHDSMKPREAYMFRASKDIRCTLHMVLGQGRSTLAPRLGLNAGSIDGTGFGPKLPFEWPTTNALVGQANSHTNGMRSAARRKRRVTLKAARTKGELDD